MTTHTLNDLQRLQQLYAMGFNNPLIDQVLRQTIEDQVARDENDLREIDSTLRAYEVQSGLSSTEFWARYQAGKAPDTSDSMEWQTFYKMRQRILARLFSLRETVSDLNSP